MIDVTADHVIDTTKENKSKAPTCETAGSYDYWCANCGEHVQEDNVSALGHEEVYTIAYDKETKMFVAHKSCSRCEKDLGKKDIVALADAGDFKVADKHVDPTCLATGKDVYKIVYKVDGKVVAEKEIEIILPMAKDHQTEATAIEWDVDKLDVDGKVIGTTHYKGYYCKTCKKIVNVTSTYTAAPVEEPEEGTAND